MVEQLSDDNVRLVARPRKGEGKSIHLYLIDDLHDRLLSTSTEQKVDKAVIVRAALVKFLYDLSKEESLTGEDGRPPQAAGGDLRKEIKPIHKLLSAAQRVPTGRIRRGRKPVLNEDQAADLCRRINGGESPYKIAEELGVNPTTVYRYLKPPSVTGQ